MELPLGGGTPLNAERSVRVRVGLTGLVQGAVMLTTGLYVADELVHR